MTVVEITLPAGDETLRLRASGAAAAAGLAALGKLLGCTALPPEGMRPDAELREPEAEPESGEKQSPETLFAMRSHRVLWDDGIPVLCRRPRLLYEERHRPVEWRILLALAAARAAADGRHIALLHGALLGEPFPGTVLFGASGIGKSTTMKRYRAAGGDGSADDQILLGQQGGVPVVRPLPSWKTFRNDPAMCTVPLVPLSRLLCLDQAERTEAESIRALERQTFQLRLFNAFLEHVSYTLRTLPNPERRNAAETICATVQRLSRQFEPRVLAARLDGDIMKTLTSCY